jgi:GTP pyrophosphokinase
MFRCQNQRKLVPISYILQNGDQVDILSSQNQKPKSDWLEFVVTSSKVQDQKLPEFSKKSVGRRRKRNSAEKTSSCENNFNDEEINKLQKFFNLKSFSGTIS